MFVENWLNLLHEIRQISVVLFLIPLYRRVSHSKILFLVIISECLCIVIFAILSFSESESLNLFKTNMSSNGNIVTVITTKLYYTNAYFSPSSFVSRKK